MSTKLCMMGLDRQLAPAYSCLLLQAAVLQAHAVACMAQLRTAVDRHFLVGITGLQSGGKSTLTEHLIGKTVSATLFRLQYSYTHALLSGHAV